MSADLIVFWRELETSFPLGGARLRLRELLGEDLEVALERAGVLVHRRVATRYPCAHYAGAGCPRVIHQRADRSFVALCGDTVAECAPVEMSRSDIDLLAVSPERLAYVLGPALRLRVDVEPIAGIPDAYRFGTFVPEPGVEHAIYFLACCTGRDYGMAVDALRTQAAGRAHAILLPTDRFVSERLRRQAAEAGVPLIALADVIELDDTGAWHSRVEPAQLFARTGIAASPALRGHVATAFVREEGRPAEWRRLDRSAYLRLLAKATKFDVFADEATRSISKRRGAERLEDVAAGHYRWIRAALASPRRFDPRTGDNDGVAAKQQFQRARHLFDIRTPDG